MQLSGNLGTAEAEVGGCVNEQSLLVNTRLA